jgi:hypothetical protein
MSAWPLHYLDIRAFVYATEVEDRVRTALQTVIGETAAADEVESSGHGGAPLTILQTRIEGSAAVAAVITQLEGALDVTPETLRDRITADAELFLSLDKQAAFGGEIRAGDGIVVRCKLEAYPATPANATAAATPLIDHLVTTST